MLEKLPLIVLWMLISWWLQMIPETKTENLELKVEVTNNYLGNHLSQMLPWREHYWVTWEMLKHQFLLWFLVLYSQSYRSVHRSLFDQSINNMNKDLKNIIIFDFFFINQISSICNCIDKFIGWNIITLYDTLIFY